MRQTYSWIIHNMGCCMLYECMDDPLWIVANGILAQSCFIYKVYLFYICTRQERKLYYTVVRNLKHLKQIIFFKYFFFFD